jgi:hypothetical protein
MTITRCLGYRDHQVTVPSLLTSRCIRIAHADQFRQQGGIGSHLENLERNDGFKGFNQTSVSEIISATDPRKQLHRAEA